MKNNDLPIAILLGDPSGIGPELIVKLLNDKITEHSKLIVIGEPGILSHGEKIVGKKTNLKFVDSIEKVNFNILIYAQFT